MEEIDAHISGYLSFVQSTLQVACRGVLGAARPQLTAVCLPLQPRLHELLAAREAVNAEIADYTRLCELLASIRDSKGGEYRSLVDVGSKCLMQAVVEEPKSVYVHVGAGFHVELGFDEAIELAHKRIEILRRRKEIADQQAAECGAHIEQAMDTISQLRQLQQGGDVSGFDDDQGEDETS